MHCVKNERTGPDLLCDNCRLIRSLESQLSALKAELEEEESEHARVLIETRNLYAESMAQLRSELEQAKSEWCEECNFPLSACGPQNSDGEPLMDCKVCQLRFELKQAREARDRKDLVLSEVFDRLEPLLAGTLEDEGEVLKATYGCDVYVVVKEARFVIRRALEESSRPPTQTGEEG